MEPQESPLETTAVEPSPQPEVAVETLPQVATETLPSLSLNDVWASRIRGGSPGVEFDELKSIGAAAPKNGVVRLTAPDGAVLAFGLVDPSNKIVRSWPLRGEEAFEAPSLEFVRSRIAKALEWRRRLGLAGEETAYRLVNAEGDDLAGFLVDVYAEHVLISTYSEELHEHAALIAAAVDAELKPKSIVSKVRPAGETPTGRLEFRQHSAEPPPKAVVVREDDARYEVHLLGGVNTGLFCDMRDVRRAYRPLTERAKVLNLFAYTGSFSVVAAQAGAKSVTSVEFAGGVVEWSKTNFTLNELPTEGKKFKFIKDDVFDFLKTARRRNELWDVIVLDPPASTIAPGRKWFLKSDYDRLISHALRVLEPGGVLLVAANSVQSRPEGVESHIRSAARETGRRLRLISSYGLPGDFPTQMIHPQSRYLKCFLLQAD